MEIREGGAYEEKKEEGKEQSFRSKREKGNVTHKNEREKKTAK